jgi:putative methyltransferase (TIGR04325 family)
MIGRLTRVLRERSLRNRVATARRKGQLALVGPCDWAMAQKLSAGYDAENIIEQVRQATRQIVNDPSGYERDGNVFHDNERPFHVAAVLCKAALEHGNRLVVLDFGGSLGSSYYQCRSLLPSRCDVVWLVVEQKRYMEIGRREFTTKTVSFHETIGEAAAQHPTVVLCSSSLQYVEEYGRVIDDILSIPSCEYLVVDRTPFTTDAGDKIFIQVVPPCIYEATYPFRAIAYEPFVKKIRAGGMRCIGDLKQEEFSSLLGRSASAYRFLVFSKESPSAS